MELTATERIAAALAACGDRPNGRALLTFWRAMRDIDVSTEVKAAHARARLAEHAAEMAHARAAKAEAERDAEAKRRFVAVEDRAELIGLDEAYLRCLADLETSETTPTGEPVMDRLRSMRARLAIVEPVYEAAKRGDSSSIMRGIAIARRK